MSRILVHMAVPAAKRALAAQMAGLSGNVTEHSVELNAIEGGPSDLWSESQGRAGESWWGASQAFAAQIAQTMLQSGLSIQTEGWAGGFDEETGTLVYHNLPTPPTGPTFEEFLTAAGLQRIEQVL